MRSSPSKIAVFLSVLAFAATAAAQDDDLPPSGDDGPDIATALEAARPDLVVFVGPSARLNDAALDQVQQASPEKSPIEAVALATGTYRSVTLSDRELTKSTRDLQLASGGSPSLSMDARRKLLALADAVVFVPSGDEGLDARSFERWKTLIEVSAKSPSTKAVLGRSKTDCERFPDFECIVPEDGPLAVVHWSVTTTGSDAVGGGAGADPVMQVGPMTYPAPARTLPPAVERRRATAKKAVEGSAFAKAAASIREALLPTVWLVAQKPGVVAPGATHFGGDPDLPVGFSWPSHEGDALTFLAQINLSDAKDLDGSGLLPERGWLVFFFDSEHQPWGMDFGEAGSAHVAWFEAPPATLRRSQNPRGTDAPLTPFVPVVMRPGYTLPTGLGPEAEDALAGRPDGSADPQEVWSALRAKVSLVATQSDQPHHHLLGHPDEIQGEMRGNLSGIGAEASSADDWILLLQLDSEVFREQGEWRWGDGGRLYFWIRKDQLAQRKFDEVWWQIQCY